MGYDSLIIEFVSNNYLTLTIAFTMLKGIAKITPWAWDDSIVSLLFGVFSSINPVKKTDDK